MRSSKHGRTCYVEVSVGFAQDGAFPAAVRKLRTARALCRLSGLAVQEAATFVALGSAVLASGDEQVVLAALAAFRDAKALALEHDQPRPAPRARDPLGAVAEPAFDEHGRFIMEEDLIAVENQADERDRFELDWEGRIEIEIGFDGRRNRYLYCTVPRCTRGISRLWMPWRSLGCLVLIAALGWLIHLCISWKVPPDGQCPRRSITCIQSGLGP